PRCGPSSVNKTNPNIYSHASRPDEMKENSAEYSTHEYRPSASHRGGHRLATNQPGEEKEQ
ncbi:hypothetical protein, partial [Mycolicibacterium llatzerense]|uniref:hypothetical protein n=1 Tax=Mycolicibacterium llatzerense TaxID=280871 RepID=UPI001F2FC23E